jgi:hypothetical protein
MVLMERPKRLSALMVRPLWTRKKARVQDKEAAATGMRELTSEATAGGKVALSARAINAREPYDSVAALLLCVIGQTNVLGLQVLCEVLLTIHYRLPHHNST